MCKLLNNRFFICISAYLLICILFFSCAQIVTPTGGPRDVKPPRAIRYIPDSAAINFKAKNIAIAFNEYIVLADLQKQLVISPPMKKMPDVKTKGKMLLIELKDTLKKNTTYTFNFGNSIRDYTEGNALEDFHYVFSTGNYIDSLSLSGIVKNASDLKTEKGILVMLYDVSALSDKSLDSVPNKIIPSYFAKTNADGSYKINNIRASTYKAFTLKDINANYLYDSPEENIAFCDSLINISKNTKLDMILFKEEPKKQKLLKVYFPEHGHLMFSFAKPIVDPFKLDFLSEQPKENVIYEYSTNKDTVHYWFADDLKDTLKIKISEGNKILDTVRLKPITLEQIKNSKRGVKWGLSVKMNVSKDKLFDLDKRILFAFNHPITEKDKIFSFLLKEDTIVIPIIPKYNPFGPKIPYLCDDDEEEWYPRKSTSRKLSLGKRIESSLQPNDTAGVLVPVTVRDINWSENTPYHLFILPATFTDIFGLKNDTIKIDFKTQEEKFYGTLKLNVKIKKSDLQYIVQFLDEKDNVVKQDLISEATTLNYSYLSPGTYKLKLINDENRDEKWSTGNYLQKQQPEKIIYYPGSITIRSNWDLELEWKP
ncbi:MAG: Ig-like domain-containing protein [Bacteroidia bacterium]